MNVEEKAIALGLNVRYRIFRNAVQVGFISERNGHYDAVAFDNERFDLSESQPLFGSDLYAIAMRLRRIGCVVVSCEVVLETTASGSKV